MSQHSSLRLRRSRFDWRTFDKLPRHVKELCWEFGCHWIGAGPDEARMPAFWEQLESKRREACRETYGPEHPSAQVTFTLDDFLD